MKTKIFAGLCILLLYCVAGRTAPRRQDFDREAFYSILKSGDINEIDKELAVIEGATFSEKDAYKGTLLMKKASLVKKPKEKLALFKEGRIKLETELHNNIDNTEYHFLRLIIQEHAPKITKYRSQLTEDSKYIENNFNSLPPVIQNIVIDYSKSSAVLHRSDL